MGKIYCVFYVSLDPLNKATKKLKNKYHVEFLDSLEDLVVRSQGYNNLERAKAPLDPPELKLEQNKNEKWKKKKESENQNPTTNRRRRPMSTSHL